MSCVHHVKVNWFEAETEPLMISPYYEWRKRDFLDTYQTLPVLCLEPSTFHLIETSLAPLPKELMRRMFQSSYKHHHRYDFGAIICDQTAVLAIDTLGYDFPLLKSRLTPIKEKQVLTMCQTLKPCQYQIEKQRETPSIYHLTHPHLVGLTRKEREIKSLLLFMLEQLTLNEQYEALTYFTTLYYRLKKRPAKDFGPSFLEELKTGYTAVHEELVKNMLPLDACYQELYEEAVVEETFEHFQY
ncbi:UPF0736 protein [Halolactibacillus miurensis]|uniref:UPF0736 protein n=1 Tax=Halolactibacillus miurensis TaxID=306541 RepID=A0A1I6S4M4_9BACI|nr:MULTISPECIES: DUF3603 family protein [Halolactibacillus]GEM04928.1 UPF0736 protein [Halolactibacillus miurensis]SFS71844.1 Protein of unknown function [Halolactibacillus miurensis]